MLQSRERQQQSAVHLNDNIEQARRIRTPCILLPCTVLQQGQLVQISLNNNEFRHFLNAQGHQLNRRDAATHQWSCSCLEVLLLCSVFIEHLGEVVRLTPVTIFVPLRSFWRCNCNRAAGHCMYTVLFAPTWNSMLHGRPDAHNHLQANKLVTLANAGMLMYKLAW